MLARRSEQLHFVHAELDADVADRAGLAEAGADTVELGIDG